MNDEDVFQQILERLDIIEQKLQKKSLYSRFILWYKHKFSQKGSLNWYFKKLCKLEEKGGSQVSFDVKLKPGVYKENICLPENVNLTN